jgi:hypothetical protein
VKREPKDPSTTPSRRAFLGAVAAAAGAVAVAGTVESDRPDPPEKRLLSARVRWIGHC